MSNKQKTRKAPFHYTKKKSKEEKMSNTVGTPASEKSKERRGKRTKTVAKAMGLKTVLVAEDRVVVASFADSKTIGDYKCANIEKITDHAGKEIGGTPRMFRTEVDPRKVAIQKGGTAAAGAMSAVVDNPYALAEVGKDYVGIKGALEKEFFGREFEGDNLRVQIAYNIIDIKKILGVHVGNIINIFYNLNRTDEGVASENDRDLIGTLYIGNSLQEQEEHLPAEKSEGKKGEFEALKKMLSDTSAYSKYFGTLFRSTRKKTPEERELAIEHNYNVLRLLSLIRQLTVHAAINVLDKTNEFSESYLFDLAGFFDARPALKPLRRMLDEMYDSSVKKLNDSFCKNSANNLYVISRIYGEKSSVVDIVGEYYRLVMLKEELNLGLNVRHLRELIVKKHFKELLDKGYDTYRGKIYTVMNYILYKTLLERDGLRAEMVERLRANMDGDEGREKIYLVYADKVAAAVKPLFNACEREFIDQKYNKFKGAVKDDVARLIANIPFALKSANTDLFVKLLFVVCKFLDGKEINEMLCALINKFDNISDLVDMARASGVDMKFAPAYRMFEDSRKIGRDIRALKNVASKEFSGIKKDKGSAPKKGGASNDAVADTYSEKVYLDALALLGWDIVRTEKDEDGEEVKTADYRKFREVMFETKCYRRGGRESINHQARNFVLNNVIKSKWFFYVVKYNSPSNCRRLMQNEELLRLVFDDLPDSLLFRYYRSVTAAEPTSRAQAVTALLKKLAALSAEGILTDMINMRASDYSSQEPGTEKERKKALVQLYLMAAYQITKNLVKINTRFSIAFSVYERDHYFKNDGEVKRMSGQNLLELTCAYRKEDYKIYEKWKEEIAAVVALGLPKEERNPRLRAVDKILKSMHFTRPWLRRIDALLKQTEGKGASVYRQFRNKVEHLNIVRDAAELAKGVKANSFYGVYCYCLQKSLKDEIERCLTCYHDELEIVFESGRYCKDLMWALDLPFAYNIARYKNLSNEYLFNERDGKEQLVAERESREARTKTEES